MVKGEKDAFSVLQRRMDPKAKYIWFHAASLGEFEQGRPLIEEIRKRYPEYKILQTFFHLPDTRYGKITREPTWYVICLWTRLLMLAGLWKWRIRAWPFS